MPSAEHNRNLDLYLGQKDPAGDPIAKVVADLNIVQALDGLAAACGANGLRTESFTEGGGDELSHLRLTIEGGGFDEEAFKQALRAAFTRQIGNSNPG